MAQETTPKSALVIVLDGVSPDGLGPYGATWLQTPTWNQLAAEGFTFDCAWSIGSDLATIYAGYWQGLRLSGRRHPCVATSPDSSLPIRLATCGLRTALLSDDPSVMELSGADFFAERYLLDLPLPQTPAASAEEMYIAQTLVAAWDTLVGLANDSPAFLLWVHLRALSGPWDAPYALRLELTDEEDPQPATWIWPPTGPLSASSDPDALWLMRCAYGAQMVALDSSLGLFLDALQQEVRRDDLLLVVTAPRGFPLGDHGFVGFGPTGLYSDVLRVPLICRFADRRQALGRSAHLVQPADLHAALLQWAGATLPAPFQDHKTVLDVVQQDIFQGGAPVVARGALDLTLRTEKWFLRTPHDGRPELFAKPDDRYDVHDLADRCPDVIEELKSLLDVE